MTKRFPEPGGDTWADRATVVNVTGGNACFSFIVGPSPSAQQVSCE